MIMYLVLSGDDLKKDQTDSLHVTADQAIFRSIIKNSMNGTIKWKVYPVEINILGTITRVCDEK